VTNLRVMTFNMLHAPGDRLAELVEVVKSVGPDILACQEVNTFAGMMALSRELDMLPVWGEANSNEDSRDGQPLFEHLVILSRLAPSEVRAHPGDRRAMFRPVLEVRLQPPGCPEITVFTVHFRAVLDPHERFLKFRELGSFLSVVGGAPGPVIAMGDFNALAPEEVGEGDVPATWPEDHALAVRGGVVSAIVGSGLVDSYRLVHPYDGQPVSSLRSRPASRVDYIFVNELLRENVRRSYILDNELVAKASDHRPVVTELAWGEE